MKSLTQLFSIKKTENSSLKSFDENEEDREQIRITYLPKRIRCLCKSNRKTNCFESLPAKFIYEF